MLLSARLLNAVGNVNIYEIAQNLSMFEGDSGDFYIQLIDASVDRPEQGFMPSGRRYCPAAGASLTVKLVNIDSAKELVKTCSQPFANDSSIWKFTVAASDKLVGTIDFVLTLTQSGVVTGGRVSAAMAVQPASTVV